MVFVLCSVEFCIVVDDGHVQGKSKRQKRERKHEEKREILFLKESHDDDDYRIDEKNVNEVVLI